MGPGKHQFGGGMGTPSMSNAPPQSMSNASGPGMGQRAMKSGPGMGGNSGGMPMGKK